MTEDREAVIELTMDNAVGTAKSVRYQAVAEDTATGLKWRLHPDDAA